MVIRIRSLSGASLRKKPERYYFLISECDTNVLANSGAYSVGAHLVTNNGDNEGLFRAGTGNIRTYLTQ